MKIASTATENQKLRFEIFLSTEKFGLEYKTSVFETNSYYFAMRKAKSLSKTSHIKKPKKFKGSEYNYISNVFDNVQKQVIADFADGQFNYIKNPIKPVDSKYYFNESFPEINHNEIKLGNYYTELTGATDKLVDIVNKYISKYINIDYLGTLANSIKNTLKYEEALQVIREWKQMYIQHINIPTMKAAYEIAKIYHKKSSIDIIYVNSLTT